MTCQCPECVKAKGMCNACTRKHADRKCACPKCYEVNGICDDCIVSHTYA
jgi:hypothetical protein